MNRNFWILMIVALAFVSQAYAINVYPKDTFIDLKYPCFNNNTYCSSTAQCNITILYPNTTVLVNNDLMTNQIAFHNYSITPKANGDYQAIMLCRDGVLSGFSSFNFRITPSGEDVSTARALIYFMGVAVMLALLIFLIYLAFKIDNKDTHNELGDLIKVNFKKHFKEVLFMVAYLVFVILLVFMNKITSDILYSNAISPIFELLSRVSVILIVPLMIVIALFFVVGVLYDFSKKAKIKRWYKNG